MIQSSDRAVDVTCQNVAGFGRNKFGPAPRARSMIKEAKFKIGQVVRHRIYPFRGVVFDVDPQFDNTDEWYDAIPEDVRPRKDQPFYHLFAENDDTEYVAYVSEQNLVPEKPEPPLRHPQIAEMFTVGSNGQYEIKEIIKH